MVCNLNLLFSGIWQPCFPPASPVGGENKTKILSFHLPKNNIQSEKIEEKLQTTPALDIQEDNCVNIFLKSSLVQEPFVFEVGKFY